MSLKRIFSTLLVGASIIGFTLNANAANASSSLYKEKATTFLAGFNEVDPQKVLLHFSGDNPKYLVPFSNGILPEKVVGVEQVHGLFNALPNYYKEIQLEIEDMVVDKEKRTVVATTSAKFVKTSDGVSYKNNMVFIFKFDERGKFDEVSEYFNPIPVAVAYEKEGFNKMLIDKLTGVNNK